MEENLPIDIKLSAGVLSTLVTLCLAVENRPKAANLLKEAVSNKKGSSKSKSSDMSMIWRKTAEFHLKGDEPSVASQSLEELLKVDPNNVQTKAQLVLAYAKYDLKKALEASKKLPKFTEQSKIDVDSLESSSFVSAKYGKKTPKPGDPTTPKKPAGNYNNTELSLSHLHSTLVPIMSQYVYLFQKLQVMLRKQSRKRRNASTRRGFPKRTILM